VTRDAGEAEWRLANRRVVLVDTGGWQAGEDGIAGEVAERSLREAHEADVALLVLDALETTVEDERLMEVLRPLADRVVLVANKVDTADRDPLVWNRLAHGFPSVVGVSAVHRRNLDALAETVEALLDERMPEATDRDRPSEAAGGKAEIRIAILGRPNTGKSSLANRLLGRARSIVSAVPGTTRDVVVGGFQWRNTGFRLLDTAGLRRRTHIGDAVEYYSAARARETVRACDLVFLVVDAVEGLSDQDKKIAALSVAEGRGLLIVLNKWDLIGRQADGMARRTGLAAEARERIRFQFPVLAYAPVLTVSARTGAGVARLLATAVAVHAQLTRRAGTGRLNQALAGWVARYRPPGRGANFRIRYLVQVSTNPVRFAAFVNRLAGFPASYTQYLENCIRRDFDVPNVPVAIELRQSPRATR
jgi:GTP-binding protein